MYVLEIIKDYLQIDSLKTSHINSTNFVLYTCAITHLLADGAAGRDCHLSPVGWWGCRKGPSLTCWLIGDGAAGRDCRHSPVGWWGCRQGLPSVKCWLMGLQAETAITHLLADGAVGRGCSEWWTALMQWDVTDGTSGSGLWVDYQRESKWRVTMVGTCCCESGLPYGYDARKAPEIITTQCWNTIEITYLD